MRAVPLGVLGPLEASVLLTIAITTFAAPGWVKGVIAAAAGVGFLAGPTVTALTRRSGRPVTVVAAAVTLLGAVAFAVAAIGRLGAFVVGSVVAVAAVNAVIPLVTVIYERNFPVSERGRRVGWGMALRVVVSAVAGLAMGAVLRGDPGRWRLVVLAGAVAAATLALAGAQWPSAPLTRVAGVRNRPWPHLGLLRADRRLALTIVAWMFMGFGNLMLLPLRVEYLAEPRYGIGADAARVTLLTVTVPSVVRLACLPVFGRVFDRVSFFAARIGVNVLFSLYVLAFFTGTSAAGLFAGSVLFGVAVAGGDLMWNLWVTKFAPAGRVADYMGIHTFFTGLRAVSAPMVAFLVIERVSLTTVAWSAAGLMAVSSLILLPEARADRAAVRAVTGAG